MKEKERQNSGAGMENFRPAEKFFEYKNEMPAGPRKAALRKKAGAERAPAVPINFIGWDG